MNNIYNINLMVEKRGMLILIERNIGGFGGFEVKMCKYLHCLDSYIYYIYIQNINFFI